MLAHQLHPETGRLELIGAQHFHEVRPILRALQSLQLVLERGSHPLHRVSEQMEEQETLHLEADIGIDDDSQPVENAGARRLQITVLDDEALLDDAGRNSWPEIDDVVGRHLAHETSADELVSGKRSWRNWDLTSAQPIIDLSRHPCGGLT